MRRMMAAILGLLSLAAATQAAEIRLRGECQPRGNLVCLADIAEISAQTAAEEESLGKIELFPAPAPGNKRYFKIRELQELLLLRGVNLTEQRFSGAGDVEISRADCRPAAVESGPPERVLSTSDEQRAARMLRDGLRKRLDAEGVDLEELEIAVVPSEDQVKQLVTALRVARVTGGEAPWIGEKQFTAKLDTAAGVKELTFVARLEEGAVAVVPVRTLARGTTIVAADVELVRGKLQLGKSPAVTDLSDCIGKQTTLTIPAGRPIEQSSLTAPIAVQKGDVVTVYSRAPGIRIRTTARAKEAGSLGSSIAVESLLDRKTMLVKVTGLQEVEAGGPEAKKQDGFPNPSGASAASR